jgi:hypothetical protein
MLVCSTEVNVGVAILWESMARDLTLNATCDVNMTTADGVVFDGETMSLNLLKLKGSTNLSTVKLSMVASKIQVEEIFPI